MPLLRTLDFTRALPEGCTFQRSTGRLSLQSGQLVQLSSDQPAIESTDRDRLGISIQQDSSNFGLTVNEELDLVTVTPAPNSLTGNNDARIMAEVAGVNNHQRIIKTIPDLIAGERYCLSAYAASVEGSEQTLIGLNLTRQYDNQGATATFRNDGIEGVSLISDENTYTDVKIGYERANSEFVRYWISGVKVSNSWGSLQIRTYDYVSTNSNTIANVNHNIKLFGEQIEVGVERPSSFMKTVNDNVSRDILSITDTTGLSSPVGTIVIEHDVREGSLLSSSGQSVIDSQGPGRIALAWSGSTSSLCHNAGEVESGPAVSVTGNVDVLSDVTGHIKSIRIYDERLSDEELKLLTAKDSTAKSKVYRISSLQSRLPSSIYSNDPGYRQISRFPFTITHDCSSLRLVFNNWLATTSGDNLASDLTVHKCALEIGSEFIPVTFNGEADLLLNAGDADIPSDDLGFMAQGTEGFIRLEVSGDEIVGSRLRFENGATSYVYSPALGTAPDVYGTGGIGLQSGGGLRFANEGHCPIMIGISDDPLFDPESAFVVGDSLVAGTNNLVITGTFMNKAAVNTNTPLLLHAIGGEHHYHRDASTRWRESLKYCRTLFDNMYANNGRGSYGAVHSIYSDAKAAGIENIYRIETFPSGLSNDNWATDQFNITPRPNLADINAQQWLDIGYIDGIVSSSSIIDPVTGGWLMNGTEFYMTVDGTHQSDAADDFVAISATAFLQDIVLSQPVLSGVDILAFESPINKSHTINGDGTTFGIQFSCVFDVKSNIKQD